MPAITATWTKTNNKCPCNNNEMCIDCHRYIAKKEKWEMTPKSVWQHKNTYLGYGDCDPETEKTFSEATIFLSGGPRNGEIQVS